MCLHLLYFTVWAKLGHLTLVSLWYLPSPANGGRAVDN